MEHGLFYYLKQVHKPLSYGWPFEVQEQLHKINWFSYFRI